MQATSPTQSKEDALRGIVQAHLRKRHWEVLYRLNVSFADTPSLVEAGIDRETWMIHQQIDPNVAATLEQLVAKERVSVSQPTESLLCATADHEEGHWSVCPFDRDYAEDILHGIATGLKAGGLKEDEVIGCTPDVANMFMDYIDNSVKALHATEGRAFADGISLFYLNQVRMPQCTPGYLLFTDAQMKTFGSSKAHAVAEKTLLGGIFGGQDSVSFRTMTETNSHYKKIAKDSQRLTATLLPKALTEKAYAQPLDSYDAKLITEELTKRDTWGKKAAAFAEVFAPYAKQTSQEQQDGKGDGKSGQGNGQSKPQQQSQGGNQKDNPSSGQQHKHSHGRCGFVKKMLEDPESKKDFINRALNKGRQPGTDGIPYVTQQESYEAAYERAAEEIVVKYFKDTEENDQPTFDLFYMQDRALDEDAKITGRMHWSKTMFVPTPDGKKALLYERDVPYQVQEDMLPGTKGLEDILFVVDTSNSMGWTGKPLDGSKYDLALRSVFGTIKGLERLGRAAYAKYGMALFSDKTEFSGWEDYYGLDRFKKLVFTGYQAGWTVLDPEKMKTVLAGNKDKFLMIMISDGEIPMAQYANPPDPVPIVKSVLDAGNDVVQFCIGGATSFSQKIKRLGADIVPVNNPADLTGLVLQKTLGRYA